MLSVPARLLLPTGPGAFRLWLALVVVLHHFIRIDFGQSSVMVFFALSGFWVQRTWYARYVNTRAPWITFVVSRWWRIAPMVVFATPLSLLAFAWVQVDLVEAFQKEGPLILFSSLFLLGYNWLHFQAIGPAWSLDLEMQFYLLAPVLCWLARRIPAAVFVVIASAISWYSVQYVPRVMLNDYIFFFAIGMAAARVNWQPGKGLAFTSGALTMLLVIGVLFTPWHSVISGGGPYHRYFFWYNWLLAVAAMPFAFYTVWQAADATDHLCADLSFLVYLLHWPAIILYRKLPSAGFAGDVAIAAALFALTILASLAARRFIDRPFNRARAGWVARRQVASVDASE